MQTFKCTVLLFGVLLAAACARSVERNDGVGNDDGNAHVASQSKSDNGKEIDYFKILSKKKVGDVRGVIQKGLQSLKDDLEEFAKKNNLGKVDGLKWKAFNDTIEKRLSVLKQNDENSWRDFVSDFRAAYKEFIQDVSHSGEIKKENNAQWFLEKGFISIISEIEKLLSSTDGPLKTFLSFIHREATTPAADAAQNASTPGIFVGIGLTVNQILRPNDNGNIQYDIATNNNQNASGGIFQHLGQIFRPANGIQNDTNILQNNGGQNGPIQTQPQGPGVLQAFGHAVNNILRPGNNSRINSTLNQNDNSVINNQTQNPNIPNVGVFQALGQAVSNIFRPPTGNFAQSSLNDTQNGTNVQNDKPSTTTHKPNKRRKPKPPQQDDSVQTTEKPYVIQILNVYTDPNTAQNFFRPQSDENQDKDKTQSLNIVLHLVYDKVNKTEEDGNVSLSSQPQGSNEDVVANVNTKPGEPVNIYLDFGSILSEIAQKNSSGNKPLQTPYISVINKPMEKPSTQMNVNEPLNQNASRPIASQGVAQMDQFETNPEPILQNYSVQQPNGSNSSLHILVIQTPKHKN